MGSAHQRGVGGGAGVDDQLHADDTAQDTHDDAEDQDRGLPELGMFLDGDRQLFIVLHFFFHSRSSLVRLDASSLHKKHFALSEYTRHQKICQ